MLTALIVDDEPLARQELQFLLEAAGDVEVVAQGANGIEAVDLIRTHQPDVLFLDVRMPGLDGFAVLKKVLAGMPPQPGAGFTTQAGQGSFRMPAVVFATAFDQYAVRAFEVNAVDYLLKPFDGKRLHRTLDKLRARLKPVEQEAVADRRETAPEGVALAERVAGAEAKLDALLRMLEDQAAAANATGSGGHPLAPATQALPTPPGSRTGKVVVRSGSRMLLVDQREICFAGIEGGEISVVTKNLEGSSNLRTLEDLMDQLDPEQFWRPHRSYLVNLQHIREVMPWFKGSYQLRMDDKKATEIPVSRMQTKRLRELFSL